MRTLLDEQYAPITSEIGFVELPLEQAADLLAGWRRGLGWEVTVTDVSADGFPYVFHRLEPLTVPTAPRELLVEMEGWTAYFNCGLFGATPAEPIGYLAESASVQGLAIATIPDHPRRPGAVKWELFADHPTAFINYRRTIGLVHDHGGWVFEMAGEQLPFEDAQRYRAIRKRQRFDSALVERYSKAIGVRPFDRDAYGPGLVLVASVNPRVDDRVVSSMSLFDAQARFGIEPGRASALPG